MKNTVLLLILIVLGIATISAQENKVKTYKIKSGYVKYKALGKNTTGVHEIWWDNYGEYMRDERNITTTTKFFGKKDVKKEHTVTITKGKFIWTADIEKGTGSESVNPMYDMMQSNMGQMNESEQEQMANAILGGLGGKKSEKEKFMGYNCEVTKMLGSKVWTYKGVVLKSESKMLGMKSGEEAIDFNPNVSVSSAKFEPLSNIKYEKAPDMDEVLAQMNEESGEREKIVPLTYPFGKFKSKVLKYNLKGYMRMGPMNMMNEGIYTCAWMRGENDMVGLSAMSIQNTEEINLKEISKVKGIETFNHKGNTCYYGVPDMSEYESDGDNEEPSPILIVVYKQYDMMLLLTGKPDKSKTELLNIINIINL